jgi:hypothetical protein
MKTKHRIALGVTITMVSTGAWFGCSSNSSNGSPDAGSGSTSSGTTSTSSSSTSTGGGTSSSVSSSSSSSGAEGGTSLTWGGASGVYATVIMPHCLPCHTSAVPLADGGTRIGGGLRVGMLDMASVDAGYSNLIDMAAMGTSVPATDWMDAAVCNTLEAGAPGHIRVVPGDASTSLIALKVNGFTTRPPCGAPMPEPAPGPGEIDGGGQDTAYMMIRDWINQGAKP